MSEFGVKDIQNLDYIILRSGSEGRVLLFQNRLMFVCNDGWCEEMSLLDLDKIKKIYRPSNPDQLFANTINRGIVIYEKSNFIFCINDKVKIKSIGQNCSTSENFVVVHATDFRSKYICYGSPHANGQFVVVGRGLDEITNTPMYVIQDIDTLQVFVFTEFGLQSTTF